MIITIIILYIITKTRSDSRRKDNGSRCRRVSDDEYRPNDYSCQSSKCTREIASGWNDARFNLCVPLGLHGGIKDIRIFTVEIHEVVVGRRFCLMFFYKWSYNPRWFFIVNKSKSYTVSTWKLIKTIFLYYNHF